MPCDVPSAMPRAWTRRRVTQQGPQFARTEGLFLFDAVTRISATRLRHSRHSHVGPNPTHARTGRVMMTVAPSRAKLPPCGVSRLEGWANRLPRRCIPCTACASLWRLLRAVHPRPESAMDGCFHGSFTNLFDVKENVRVTPITSYDQRCVVLHFQTIVDAPCPPRCNRA